MKRNESCTIDLEQQPLMEVWEQIRAPISRTENLKGRSSIEVRTEATRNFILKAEIWMNFFDDIFGSSFQRARGSGTGPRGYRRKGADVTAKLEVTFEEAAFGGDKVISYTDASGRAQSLKVHIPAGISSGKKIRLKGKGQDGMNGGEAGDLFLGKFQ